MAGGSGRQGKGGTTLAAQARAALTEGDFAQARALAQQAIDDSGASEQEKKEAREVLDATRIDRGPVIAGLVMLAILIALFAWVLTQKHAG